MGRCQQKEAKTMMHEIDEKEKQRKKVIRKIAGVALLKYIRDHPEGIRIVYKKDDEPWKNFPLGEACPFATLATFSFQWNEVTFQREKPFGYLGRAKPLNLDTTNT
jgi:hypothetical protein